MNEKDPRENIPSLDIAKIIRSQALTASRTGPAKMTPVRQIGELPLAAVLEGGGWARKVFRPSCDPRKSKTHTFIGYAIIQDAGVDMVRIEYLAEGNPMSVLEGKTFYLVITPQGFSKSLLPEVLLIEKPLAFQGPDPQGWLSSSPELPAQKMKDWKERIDAIDFGGRIAFLIFKIEKSARQFTPSSAWF
jgi:hypothetical protein